MTAPLCYTVKHCFVYRVLLLVYTGKDNLGHNLLKHRVTSAYNNGTVVHPCSHYQDQWRGLYFIQVTVHKEYIKNWYRLKGTGAVQYTY